MYHLVEKELKSLQTNGLHGTESFLIYFRMEQCITLIFWIEQLPTRFGRGYFKDPWNGEAGKKYKESVLKWGWY